MGKRNKPAEVTAIIAARLRRLIERLSKPGVDLDKAIIETHAGNLIGAFHDEIEEVAQDWPDFKCQDLFKKLEADIDPANFAWKIDRKAGEIDGRQALAYLVKYAKKWRLRATKTRRRRRAGRR